MDETRDTKPVSFQKTGFWLAMVCVYAFIICAAQGAFGQAQVTNAAGEWVLENTHIKATFNAETGKLSVLDKQANVLYKQPDQAALPPTKTILIPKATGEIKADGDLSEWTGVPVAVLTSDMTPDGNWKNVKDNRDCSAVLYAAWDEKNLYLAAKVIDEKLVWGEKGRERWWDKDSVEFWVWGRQVGLSLNPEGSQARSASEGINGGSQIALRILPALGDSKDMEQIAKMRPQGGDVKGAGGYVLEAVFPWAIFPEPKHPGIGTKIPFAFGVNDADDTGEREGQLYFPETWVHSRPETFAQAVLADASGTVPAEAAKPKSDLAKIRNVAMLPAPAKGISYETDAAGPKGEKPPVIVKLSLADEAADLTVDFDMANRDAEISEVAVFEPLALDSPQGYFAVTDYGNGHIYRLDDPKPPRAGFGTDRMDMPWIGILDLEKGYGYILVVDTSDDGTLRMKRCQVGEKAVLAPQIAWRSSMGKFSYPRRLIYHFSPSGSYVALAKYYREYAKGKGLIVPFTEKVKKNPNLDRLFGAPDVWGAGNLKFCREAKAAGVDRMLINGRPSPEDMKEINQLGYLTSEYDNYTDILQVKPEEKVGSNKAHLPEDVVLMKDGKRMTAWLTYDKKTQFMKRCPTLWVPTARTVIPELLQKYPYIGRFIDVTTAEGLYECYDPKHPMTKTQKRECGVGLLSVVRENGLVVGGEHGIWWAVPVQDYIEGMMSGGYAAWPAGHLIYPKKMEELTKPDWKVRCSSWEDYQKFGIGHYYRVPLWELVFHDCIVSTWYWGDATDWLLNVDPANSEKKDAFNILYGTIPLMWAGPSGKPFKDHREQFVRSYRNTCKIHETLAYEELVSHEFVTPDHAVQRTRFSSGTEVTVNFGEAPYAVSFEGKSYELPTNGFFVHGPKVFEYCAKVDGKLVTYIQTPGYVFADGHGQRVDAGAVSAEGAVTVKMETPKRMRIVCDGTKGIIVVRPKTLSPDWDLASTRVYSLDEKGQRAQALAFEGERDELRLAAEGLGGVEALCSEESRYADMAVDAKGLKLSNPSPKQGDEVTLSATVRNIGLAAGAAKVHVYLDEINPDRTLLSQDVSLQPGEQKALEVKIDTKAMDGNRRVIVIADQENALPELSECNNEAACDLKVTADPALWPFKVRASVSSGELERQDYPVVLPLDLGDLARRVGAKQGVNSKTLRVFECDAEGKPMGAMPAQFDPAGDIADDQMEHGELSWILVGTTPPNATRHFLILFDTDPAAKLLPPSVAMWDEEKKAVSTPAYTAVFDDAVISGLYDKLGTMPDRSIVSSVIVSSKITGWNREEGTTDAFIVKHRGPVRTVIQVKKTLAKEYVYEKTYTFYPSWFEVETTFNKQVGGLYNRSWYTVECQFEDDKGSRAWIDGKGEAEGIYGNAKDAKWYAVYTPAWAHSCLALTPAGTIAYWDAGAMGGTGFHMRDLSGAKVAYDIHPGQKDASFAKADYEQLTKRPVAKLE